MTDVIEVKASALRCHRSQLTWLREHDGIDVVEQMETASRYRGMQCGARFAEGFVACAAWLRGSTRRLLP